MDNDRKLGIMQPYFFPYIGYFALINYVDHYLFFDTAQYVRRSWMNRNRILNPTGDFSYISVPVQKAPQKTAIKDVFIDNSQAWKQRLFNQLNIYIKAPNFKKIIDFLHSVLENDCLTLGELNISTTKSICHYLGINTEFETFSDMDITYDQVNAPDEWALNITKSLGYSTYVNAIGGTEFFDRTKYRNNSIDLYFLKAELVPYVQRIGRFVEGLSIIDVMMFNSVEEIRLLLDRYTLI